VRIAGLSENDFHGNPSGVDVEVVARGLPVFFSRTYGARPVHARRSDFHFLVAHTGVSSATAAVVADVAGARESDGGRSDAVLRELGVLSREGRRVLEEGTPGALGPLMNRAQELLASLDVSSVGLDSLCRAALAAGALGAKLSGAGRGGAIVALVTGPEAAPAVEDACRRAGATDACSAALLRAPAEVRS